MPEIIPAIMPKTFDEITEKVALVRGLVDYVQIDVMDGIFVPNKSWPFPDFDKEVVPFLSESDGLPFWLDVNYEFDLMIKDPEKFVEKFIQTGAARVIIHYESSGKDGIREAVKKVQAMDTEVGIAINTGTPNDVLDEFLNTEKPIDFVQFMGIEKIGYQGQEFDERAIAKIKALRAKYPAIMISIDGGVDMETATQLIKAGVNRLVSGHGVFDSGNIADAISKLKMVQ